jgi:putative flippase GtrA
MQQLVRYFFVGGIAAATDIGLFLVFAQLLGLPYLPVGAGSFLIATGVNYLLSIRYVFRSGSRFGKRQEILLVFLVSGIGLLVHQAVLFIAVEWLNIVLMLAKITATGTVFFWNFGARRYLIFGSPAYAYGKNS